MGNARNPAGRRSCRPVHPHVHGERSRSRAHSRGGIGSSPRTWGTRVRAGTARIVDRFIPTYMGNARISLRSMSARSVHPHVHGERRRLRRRGHDPAGSSPRTWGTPGNDALRRRLLRFIPTYMGNARSGAGSRTARSVHPHVHGERNSGQCLG